MDLINRINKTIGLCEVCGKNHNVLIEDILIDSNILKEIPSLVRKHGKKVFMISDVNTWKVAGEEVEKILTQALIPCTSYVLQNAEVEPDETSVGSVVMHFDKSCDYIVAVGSGTINDIAKIISNITNIPYMIVGTAPSMDGYASSTSSVIRDGLKISLNSTYATAIVCDINILKNAPLRMLQSGMGDMLAKYISICEWRISNLINNEYYCSKISELVRTSLTKCVKNVDGLINRDDEAVKAVTEGLILCGLAMGMAGVSRPASGMEHYFSHLWDMRAQEYGTSADLHGIQCGTATLLCSHLYHEHIKRIQPNYELAKEYIESFSWEAWKQELKALLGKSANAMIMLEEKEQKYSKVNHEKRFKAIQENWNTIIKIIDEEIPKPNKILGILEKIMAPITYRDLKHDSAETKVVFYATKDIRDKYIGSRLLWDLGLLEKVGEEYFK